MPRTTRTLNPLHFEDLEPHRFEDLIRQLIYDYRQWKSIEAIGRTGSDEGIDIRAIERLQSSDIVYEDEAVEGEAQENETSEINEIQSVDRLWIIQCKRERRIGPTRISSIVSTNLSGLTDKPYGYMIVAACDFSKKARDAFREEAVNQGVEEFIIWGKAEVEDQLYLPKNDHLLFAYFGISLQVRRKSMRTSLRAKLSLKRKLTKELGEINNPRINTSVLIRDPNEQQYPYIESPEEFIKLPRWRYWYFFAHEPPDHLAFIYRKYFAYVNWQTKEYDVLLDYDDGVPNSPEIFNLDRGWYDPNKVEYRYRSYWSREIPNENRAWLIVLRIISYDRILAFDEIGDCYNERPHLLLEYDSNVGPWEQNRGISILRSADPYMWDTILEQEGKCISFFPKDIPLITPDKES